jgi:hypothetical protein
MNFGLSGLAGRIAAAIFYGVIVFLITFVIGILLTNFGGLSEIGDLLKRFAPILGLLAGLASFFGGGHHN